MLRYTGIKTVCHVKNFIWESHFFANPKHNLILFKKIHFWPATKYNTP